MRLARHAMGDGIIKNGFVFTRRKTTLLGNLLLLEDNLVCERHNFFHALSQVRAWIEPIISSNDERHDVVGVQKQCGWRLRVNARIGKESVVVMRFFSSIICVIVLLALVFSIARDEFIYSRKMSGKDARVEGVVENAERTSSILVVINCRVRVLFRDGETPQRIEYSKRLVKRKGSIGKMECYRLTGTKVALAYDRARPEEAMVLQSAFERKSWIFLALFFAGGAVFGVFCLFKGRDA